MTENQNDYSDLYGYDTSYDTSYETTYDEPMTGPLDAPDKPSGLHPVNIGHLVMGIAFAGLVLVWALIQGDVVETSSCAGCCRSRGSPQGLPDWRRRRGRRAATPNRASRPAARTTGGRRSRPPGGRCRTSPVETRRP